MGNYLKKTKTKNGQRFIVTAVSWLVGIYGLYYIWATLFEQFTVHRLRLLTRFSIDIHLLLGLSVIYLSILLARRKRNALIVALVVLAFIVGQDSLSILSNNGYRHFGEMSLVRTIILPLAIIIALLIAHDEFKVKSDDSAFRNSLKIAIIVLLVTLAYGIFGFLSMDKTDFHQEIGLLSAVHHTVDQFDLTTNSLHPYTHRAKLFLDSLSFISVLSLGYVALSLFMPVRARIIDQSSGRERVKKLMERYGAPSEDFFKIWPADKHYFFSDQKDAALAYAVKRGSVLVLADPVGNKGSFAKLFEQFHDLCWANDWQPSLIHVDGRYINFYKDLGYQPQLIGQEAVVDISKYFETTARNKYFRNIKNRFNKENFTFELLNPPHHKAVIDRLQVISNEWLSKPGRVERGFVMGYFSEEYIQQCRIAIVRDAAQTIQAFSNIIPSHSFNSQEATYDMLRASIEAPPNINDFLLYNVLYKLHEEGYRYYSLGLSPLVGLDETSDENNLISSVLRFAYINGDRIYSFSGLHRFKDKYDPIWSDRYLAYMGGVRGFTKMANGLLSVMKVKI